jgi:hypothetical protein
MISAMLSDSYHGSYYSMTAQGMGKIVVFCEIKHEIMKKNYDIMYHIMDFYDIKVAW